MEIERSGKRIQDQDGARLGLWKKRQGWRVGKLANKVWIQPESLAGSAPRPLFCFLIPLKMYPTNPLPTIPLTTIPPKTPRKLTFKVQSNITGTQSTPLKKTCL